MFQKIWKDPVWSKVIATGIIALIAAIYVAAKGIITSVSFLESLKDTATHKIEIWIVALMMFLEFTVIAIVFSIIYRPKSIPTKNYSDVQIDHDKKLFIEIKRLMPANGSIQFIRVNNFAGSSFYWTDLDDFNFIMENSDNPDWIFVSDEFEAIRLDLFKKIKDYRYYLVTKAFTIEGRRASVPPEWEENQPERFWEVVDTLHNFAGEICEIYDRFILKGKQEYGI